MPGWGAPPSLYRPPESWSMLAPPSFARAVGDLREYRRWLALELQGRGRCALGGHSMGAALSILAAREHPELVDRLVLVAPAGLPLAKPMRNSLRDFAAQLVRGLYPGRAAAVALGAVARAPRAAIALAREIRALDLRRECVEVRASGIPCLVVGCTTDTLVTSAHARGLAELLAADYVELDIAGGHMWMLRHRARFAALLAS